MAELSETSAETRPRRSPGRLARVWDSDLAYSFRRSKVTVLAATITLVFLVAAAFAPWLAPHDPFDLSGVSLMEARLPPAWAAAGEARFPLGTDNQGRDMLSAIMYGARISLGVGFASVIFAAALGITLGLIAGYAGGALDSVIMRTADVQLTFPAILIALLIDGCVHGAFPNLDREQTAFWVLIVSIGLAFWVQYARTIRGSVLVERNKEYIEAARLIGVRPAAIVVRHILPNVTGPMLVIATINLALAIITEATLSFLGVGVPPTQPSLGTLIRIGNDYLFSGEWWITIFPGIALATLVVAVNLVGDWLRDALNPKLS